MANVLSLVTAPLALVPPAAIFFAAYGRYDGAFKDNVVFLFFIGGLVMGGFLGVITLFALAALASPIIAVVLLALFYPIATVAGINRRKWQGERHAIFNGGAFGLGIAVMIGFTIMYRLHTTLDILTVAQGAVLAAALGALFFGMGLLAGDGVWRRRPFQAALLGTAILLAPVIFLEEYSHPERTWGWLALLLAYGAVFAVAAERRLLVQGLDDEARRDRRRKRRARMAE